MIMELMGWNRDGIHACTRLHTQRFNAWKWDGHVDLKITDSSCAWLMALDPQSTTTLMRTMRTWAPARPANRLAVGQPGMRADLCIKLTRQAGGECLAASASASARFWHSSSLIFFYP